MVPTQEDFIFYRWCFASYIRFHCELARVSIYANHAGPANSASFGFVLIESIQYHNLGIMAHKIVRFIDQLLEPNHRLLSDWYGIQYRAAILYFRCIPGRHPLYRDQRRPSRLLIHFCLQLWRCNVL